MRACSVLPGSCGLIGIAVMLFSVLLFLFLVWCTKG